MRVAIVLVLGAAVAMCGCSNSHNNAEQALLAGKVGKNCTVQFRRGDGLGAGSSVPVPPTTGAFNGADVSLSGTLQAVEGGWVVVGTGTTEYCIPRESILLIQFNK